MDFPDLQRCEVYQAMTQYSVIPECRQSQDEWQQCEPEQAEAWSVWAMQSNDAGELMPADLAGMFWNKSAAERHIRLLTSREN